VKDDEQKLLQRGENVQVTIDKGATDPVTFSSGCYSLPSICSRAGA
jgi:hypothetical protein